MAQINASMNKTGLGFATGSSWFVPQPQDLVITLLGAYVKSRRDTVWSGGLVQILDDFGFSTGAARVALTRMVRRQLLTRVKDGRLVHYALTPRSMALLSEGDRRIFSLRRRVRPVEEWTVVWQTIPDNQRLEKTRFTHRLRFLGFGSLQDGIWISPHDREDEVAALASSLGLYQDVAVLLSRPAKSFDFERFARRAWDLDALAARYLSFAEEFSVYLAPRARARLTDHESFLLRTRLVHTFRAFPSLDPELPDELMPELGHSVAAVEVFDALYPALAEPAQRHFDAVTTSRESNRGSSGSTMI
nr:PaaX family transcriptional regulator C-terminal domain-containing protein [Capillimicrobium parvum]